MRRRHLVGVLAAIELLCILGCGGLFNDDESTEVTGTAPETAPPPPPPETTPVADNTPSEAAPSGTFRIPGLGDIPIPLPAPNANHEPPEPPARGSLPPVPPGSFDQHGHFTRAFLEQEASTIHGALVAALDEHERSQVSGIPFEVISEANEPNAAAACTRSRRALMMITTAMLELCAGIAETTAYDEAAGTETYADYATTVVQQVRNRRPVQGVAPGVHSAPHATDPHKLSRQRHLFEQQVAFIVGHELAHHYRGHTSCVGGRSEAEVRRDEMARILAHTVPPFSQPREVEADMWGLTNTLEAGRARPTGTWSEEGALLNLDFFRRLADRGGSEIIMAFLSTHPPSVVRIPIVQSTAQQWEPGWRPPRMPVPGDTGGGQGVEIPTPGGPLRLPIDPSKLPIPLPRPQGQ